MDHEFFVQRYHMTEESFDKLVNLLDLPVNESKSWNSTRGSDPIIKPMVVGIEIRFLGALTEVPIREDDPDFNGNPGDTYWDLYCQWTRAHHQKEKQKTNKKVKAPMPSREETESYNPVGFW
jgi:hypothetical protein